MDPADHPGAQPPKPADPGEAVALVWSDGDREPTPALIRYDDIVLTIEPDGRDVIELRLDETDVRAGANRFVLDGPDGRLDVSFEDPGTGDATQRLNIIAGLSTVAALTVTSTAAAATAASRAEAKAQEAQTLLDLGFPFLYRHLEANARSFRMFTTRRASLLAQIPLRIFVSGLLVLTVAGMGMAWAALAVLPESQMIGRVWHDGLSPEGFALLMVAPVLSTVASAGLASVVSLTAVVAKRLVTSAGAGTLHDQAIDLYEKQVRRSLALLYRPRVLFPTAHLAMLVGAVDTDGTDPSPIWWPIALAICAVGVAIQVFVVIRADGLGFHRVESRYYEEYATAENKVYTAANGRELALLTAATAFVALIVAVINSLV